MDMEKFYKTLEKGVTIVDFNAGWCPPCKAQEPIIKKLTHVYQNRAAVLWVDIDTDGALATQYSVQSIPTVLIFKDGKEMKRFVGLQSETTITHSLEKVLSRANL